jgi:hypothetical protein
MSDMPQRSYVEVACSAHSTDLFVERQPTVQDHIKGFEFGRNRQIDSSDGNGNDGGYSTSLLVRSDNQS